MLRAAHILMLAAMALLALGVVMVHSAGMTVGSRPVDGSGEPTWRFIAILTSRPAIYAAIAIAVMLLAWRAPVRRWLQVRGWFSPLGWGVIASLSLLALTFVPGMGRSINGASRWLYLGPREWGLSFQPSELVKWVLIAALAWWCSRRNAVMKRFGQGLFPPLLLVAVACGAIVVEDLGTGALIGLVAGCLLIAGGARWWHLALLVPPAAGVLVAAIMRNPYRVDRLLAFQNPWADPQGIGYHPIQSMLAFRMGGLTGAGLGSGVQKFGYLPEDTTDFIFAIICEELGLAGALLVVGLYLAIFWVGLGIVRDCRDTFGRLLGLGVLITIAFQAVINIAVVTVMVPTKGIALPLLSSGGTGWILTAAMIGAVASLERGGERRAMFALEESQRAIRCPAIE